MFLALREAGAAIRLNGCQDVCRYLLRPTIERDPGPSERLTIVTLGGGGSRTNNVRAKITNYLRQMEVSHKVKCFPRKLIAGVMFPSYEDFKHWLML